MQLVNFSPSLVLNKNTFELLSFKRLFGKQIKIKVDSKVKNTRVTTLRAPKHFKVGRHHYQIERTRAIITFKLPNKAVTNVQAGGLPLYLKRFGYLATKLGFSKSFSFLSSIRVSFEIKRSMLVV